ncbi:MAG TPA: prohibitin family protein [bacterium]|nr:prohibitin family protein [bacterium]
MAEVIQLKRGAGILKYIILGLIIAFVLLKSFVVIPAGNVGVKIFFGKVDPIPLAAGFHVVNPLLNIEKMSVRTQELTEQAVVPSREGLSVNLDVSLLYSLIPDRAAEVYRTIGPGYVAVVLEPQFRSVIRGTTASYDAKALYTSERELISEEMMKHLEPLLAVRGIKVEKVLLRAMTLPQILSEAIERKLEAEQQAEQMKFVLERERQEADRKRVEAEGVADFQKKVAEGLTDSYLKWKGIEATQKLSESGNSKVVIIGAGSSGLPVILGSDGAR